MVNKNWCVHTGKMLPLKPKTTWLQLLQCALKSWQNLVHAEYHPSTRLGNSWFYMTVQTGVKRYLNLSDFQEWKKSGGIKVKSKSADEAEALVIILSK